MPGETVTFDGPLATLRFELELRDQQGTPAHPPSSLFQNPPTAPAELELRNKLNEELRDAVENAFGDAEVDAAPVQFESGSAAAVLAINTGGTVKLPVDKALAAVEGTADGIEQSLRRYVRDFSVRNGGPPRVSIAGRRLRLAGAELGKASETSEVSFGKAARYALIIFLFAFCLAEVVASLSESTL